MTTTYLKKAAGGEAVQATFRPAILVRHDKTNWVAFQCLFLAMSLTVQMPTVQKVMKATECIVPSSHPTSDFCLFTDDFNCLPDALPTLPEVPDSGPALSSVDISARCLRNSAFHQASLRYCSALSMDSSPDSAERPISYSSTSSSASSRDSHCSLGSRSTLVAGPHCNPGASDHDSGAIRLELVPARQLECREEDDKTDGGAMDNGRAPGNQGGGQNAVELPGTKLVPDAGEQTRQVQGPRTYVDRVVQEILDTERTYVQDLQSIVAVSIAQPYLSIYKVDRSGF